MFATKHVGRNAAVKKYDLLTAMGAFALSQDKGLQRVTLRLLTLITARYNWRADELVVGRREMARLRGMGWIEVKRAGARGRITSYRLCIETIMEQTRPAWGNVGPDYEARQSLTSGLETDVTNLLYHFRGPQPCRRPICPPGMNGRWPLDCCLPKTSGFTAFG